ncbi:NAD(P)H-hydrate dehydratase [Sphingomonas sp.]|uniref:NAD(P)H-hydrate dehydratase n=1 Tax=Sphingomonas sp. TaxID=28214 RepID=UPI00286AA764|nr:NAD(P)H-hydrate dehydratase [Sphingomonas sp.]
MPRPILTAAQMRAAEAEHDGDMLMERAGAALAEAAWLFAGPIETLILCGPGNNGGDGLVAARHLEARGITVRIATLDTLADAEPAPMVIDCLFGTGLSRGLEESVYTKLSFLIDSAEIAIACDLPSGIATDDGAILSPVVPYDLTVTFGALKPAHHMMLGVRTMGRIVLADIGLDVTSDWFEIARPNLPLLDPAGNKFTRGMVHCLAGQMPGAIALAAHAAARAGAGYVRVSTSRAIDNLPSAVVQTDTAEVGDPRIGAILVGPGLGDIPPVLTLALTVAKPVIIDADAIALVGEPDRLKGHDAILTPHEGEFVKLFGELPGSKADRALEAARRSGAVVVYKGPDTLVASPDGRLGFAPPAPAWLASAGTGDVLAGIIAAFRARGMPSFEAACAGVWIHGRAAELAGLSMIADDLVAAIPRALAL